MFNPKTKISLLCPFGALGDMICALPTIKKLYQEERLHKVLVFQDKAELCELVDIPSEHLVIMHPEKLTPFDPEGNYFNSMYPQDRAPYRMHLIDFASYNACQALLKPEEKCVSVDPSKLPPNPLVNKKYVIVSPLYMHKSRRMLPSVFNDIKQFVKSLGYEVVIIGKDAVKDKVKGTDEYDFEDCINLTNRTSLRESLAIIAEAKLVITMDSGLVYLTGLTETPLVAGYTFVDPYYRLPYRHGELGWKCESVIPRGACKFCSNTLGAYSIVFDVSCPAKIDFQCATSLHSEDFISAVKKFI